MLICCYFKVYLQICVIPLFVQNCHFSPKKIKHLVATLQKNNIECIWSKSHVIKDEYLLTAKHSYSHHPYCCYIYIPGTTCLHIPLAHPCSYYYLLSPSILFCTSYLFCTFYSIAHFTLYFSSSFFFTYIYIYARVVLL